MFRNSLSLAGALAVATTITAGAAQPAASNLNQSQQPNPPSPNPIVEWNVITVGAASTAGLIPIAQARVLAMVHIAMNDAVAVTGTGEHRPLIVPVSFRRFETPEAAAIAAAHQVLVGLFTTQASLLDADYAASLQVHRINAADPGLGLGSAIGTFILARRANDGSAVAQFPYTAPGAGSPGVWVQTPPAFAPALLPGWGRVTPFVLRRGDQFRGTLHGPPALTSERFIQDFDEVKAKGEDTSAVRTAAETERVKFWAGSGPAIWNDALRKIVFAKRLNLPETARVFAIVNVVAADAGIAVWEAKYAFNFWRPITAIRQADRVGSDRLIADPDWLSFLPTPAYPEYPSGQCTLAGAFSTVLAALFGDNPGVPFVPTSPANPTLVPTWTTFSDGADEAVEARINAGVHYRTSDADGRQLGRRVARYILRQLEVDRDRGY